MKFFILIISFYFVNCQTITEDHSKINGLSVVASPNKLDQKHLKPILDTHSNYTAIMPFGFVKSLNSPQIYFNTNHQWFGETNTGAKQYIEVLQKQKLNVMLKPQIWVARGAFTGNIKMTDEKDWLALEKSYSTFILNFARLAEETQVAIFCIGTELEFFVANRPDYWKKLIIEIRKIYQGKITYAANWNEYEKTPFWTDVDYIGIDAYFPLSEQKTPTNKTLHTKWQKYKKVMKKYSDTFDKKILFTEFGYRSVDYTTSKPWDVDHEKQSINMEGQSIAIQVLFDEFWHEEWFAGGFIWKWFIDYDNAGGENDNRFTPQNKPSEQIMTDFYTPHQK